MNTIINDVYIRRTMTLGVDRADGAPPYEAKYSGTFMLGEIPSPGDVFHLRVDPKNPHHLETTDGPGYAAEPAAPPLLPQQGPTITEQLQQLDDMHHRGALTDAEFAAAKQQVLRG
ncbi:MAG TPA: SHOCT domain-containing protein [Mycobacterium sp.]|nr:SHOCT domain-containing protein [Mycobacterium sp.]